MLLIFDAFLQIWKFDFTCRIETDELETCKTTISNVLPKLHLNSLLVTVCSIKSELDKEFISCLISAVNAMKCYERRPSCLKKRGWCHAGQDFGFCSDINAVPDIPDSIYPLLEVQTFILPKEVVSMYYYQI